MSNQLIYFSEDCFTVNSHLYTKQWFIEKFLEKNMSTKEIANILNVSARSITNIAKYYNIDKKSWTYSFIDDSHVMIRGKIIDYAYLYKQYIYNGRSARDICEELNIDVGKFFDILLHFNIDGTDERKKLKQSCPFVYRGKEVQIEDLYKFYVEESHSALETAQEFGIPKNKIFDILEYYHIEKDKAQIEHTRTLSVNKKYGVNSPLQNEELKSKRLQTCIERYGTADLAGLDSVKEKMQEKYGVDYYGQTTECKDRIKKTCEIKYGDANFRNREQAKKTCMQKYKCSSPVQVNIQNRDIWENAARMEDFLKNNDKKLTIRELAEFFNVSESGATYKIHELKMENLINLHANRSRYEDEIINWLQSNGVSDIVTNNREVLNGKEIDIYLSDYRIGIEFNGDYWHSEIQDAYQDHNGRSTKHQEKSLQAEENGVFLFHIFEREWNNPLLQSKIKDRLLTILHKNTVNIGARKCEICLVSKKDKKSFLDENHIQGNDKSHYAIGLMYDNQLVACMCFVRPKNKKYSWELSRFCCKRGVNVSGGASKLLKYFIKQFANDGDIIVSYNDITKTQGTLYSHLGFTCVSVNSPNYVWYNFQTKDIRSRYQEQKSGELERMHSQGYYRVCDCGTKTWVFTVKKDFDEKGL